PRRSQLVVDRPQRTALLIDAAQTNAIARRRPAHEQRLPVRQSRKAVAARHQLLDAELEPGDVVGARRRPSSLVPVHGVSSYSLTAMRLPSGSRKYEV